MGWDKLYVSLYGRYCGDLEQDPKGRMRFTYNPEATLPLSLSLPLSKKPENKTFDYLACEPYFSGLLPDSVRLLNQLSHTIETHPNDTFGMLRALGLDCAGAVQFHRDWPVRGSPENTKQGGIRCLALELEKQIKVLDKQPFFIGLHPQPSLLSGQQHKVGITFVDNQVILPSLHEWSTHILKPAYKHTAAIQNEWFCMQLAKSVGLNVANVALHQFGKAMGLVVERMDRFRENKIVKLRHQEDFCQALGLMPHQKYQRNKGISWVECFALLEKTEVPAVSRLQLMDALIFNYLIGNTNAHGKKFGLSITETGSVTLTPLYGLKCGCVSQQGSKMAMKIGTQYDIKSVTSDDWHALCHQIEFTYPALRKRLLTLAERVMVLLPKIQWDCQYATLDDALMKNLETFITQQCEQAIKAFYFD